MANLFENHSHVQCNGGNVGEEISDFANSIEGDEVKWIIHFLLKSAAPVWLPQEQDGCLWQASSQMRKQNRTPDRGTVQAEIGRLSAEHHRRIWWGLNKMLENCQGRDNIAEDSTGFQSIYKPGHPDAYEKGNGKSAQCQSCDGKWRI